MGIRSEWLGAVAVRRLLLVALVAAGAVSVMSRGSRWLGSWKLALDETSGSIFVIGPMAAGIACGVYVRMRHSHVDDLLPQASRPWRGWTMPAVAVWALASSAVLLLGVATTSAAWIAGSTPYPQVSWAIAPALLVLGAEVAIGAMVGARVPHYWAVPWVATGTFLLYLLTRLSVVPIVFDTGPTSGELIGETFHPPWFGYQTVVALGIGCAALAASHGALFRVSPLLLRVLTAVGVVAALVTVLAVRPPLDRYQPSPQHADVCRDSRPRVCMTQDGHRPLDDLASRMESLARPLFDADADVPDRFVPLESVTAQQPDVGLLMFVDDEQLAGEVDDVVAARSLVMPAACDAFASDDARVLPETYFSVRSLLVHWLLVQVGDEPAPTDGPLAEWWGQPVDGQASWVRDTYGALRECRLLDLRLPEPPGRSPR